MPLHTCALHTPPTQCPAPPLHGVSSSCAPSSVQLCAAPSHTYFRQSLFCSSSQFCRQEYYINSPEQDPGGPTDGLTRVLRGGAFYNDASQVRSATRGDDPPEAEKAALGARCARDLGP